MATITPCPGISRGADEVVPTVPGFVSETVVPMKSSGEIVPLRVRPISASKAFSSSAKPSFWASLMFGTSSVRLPSFFWMSTAIPSRTESRWMRCGWPSTSAYASLRRGKASSARRIAQATRCVKLTLDCPPASRCLLSSRRFSSSVRTGTVRMDVAVGTWRLASMFSTMRTAPPRIGCRMSPGSTVTRATAVDRLPATGSGARAIACRPSPAGAAARAGRSGSTTVTGGSGAGATPSALAKYERQPGSTLRGSCRYCSSRSSAKA